MLLKHLEKQTPFTSSLVDTISKSMRGNTFHHHYHILYSLRDLIHKPLAMYAEIGTFNGGSLCLMLQHPNPVGILSVDPFHLESTNIDITLDNIKKFNKYNYPVELSRKYSTDVEYINELKRKGFKADILFIDGDHTFKAVINDFVNWYEFVSPGGFIVFDDYNDAEFSPEVHFAVDEIVKIIQIHKLPFEIIGSPTNFYNVYPSNITQLNEFILRRFD